MDRGDKAVLALPVGDLVHTPLTVIKSGGICPRVATGVMLAVGHHGAVATIEAEAIHAVVQPSVDGHRIRPNGMENMIARTGHQYKN
jgi:hypothetical protein